MDEQIQKLKRALDGIKDKKATLKANKSYIEKEKESLTQDLVKIGLTLQELEPTIRSLEQQIQKDLDAINIPEELLK